jgi:hypothetical protein
MTIFLSSQDTGSNKKRLKTMAESMERRGESLPAFFLLQNRRAGGLFFLAGFCFLHKYLENFQLIGIEPDIAAGQAPVDRNKVLIAVGPGHHLRAAVGTGESPVARCSLASGESKRIHKEFLLILFGLLQQGFGKVLFMARQDSFHRKAAHQAAPAAGAPLNQSTLIGFL